MNGQDRKWMGKIEQSLTDIKENVKEVRDEQTKIGKTGAMTYATLKSHINDKAMHSKIDVEELGLLGRGIAFIIKLLFKI